MERESLGFMLILMGRILIAIRRLRKREKEREREMRGEEIHVWRRHTFLFYFDWVAR